MPVTTRMASDFYFNLTMIQKMLMTPPHFEWDQLDPLDTGRLDIFFFTITTPTQETCELLTWEFVDSKYKEIIFVRVVLSKLKPPHPVTMEFEKVSIGAPGGLGGGKLLCGRLVGWEVRFTAWFFRKWGNEPNWDLAIQNDWPQQNWWLEVASSIIPILWSRNR